MRNRILIFFFLLLSYKGYSQSCVLDATITQSAVVICSGNVATLTANGGDSYVWYDAAAGGNVVSNSISYVTPALTSNTTYYVVVTANGCSSSRLPVTAIVTPTPPTPTAANVTICAGSVANLHADGPSGVFNWYTTPTGGYSVISSPDYTTPPLTATTIYYVEIGNNGCESPRVPVTVIVNPLPNAPDVQTDSVCYGGSTVLTASANPSGTYQWFDALAGGNLLATGNTYTTPSLTNSTTYYAQATNGSCVSGRIAINVIVKPQLSAPTASGAIICSGSVTTLTATSNGGTYQWYDAATGGNLLASTASFVTPALTANTTYYVQNTLSGCISPRAAVTVSIITPTPAPTAANVTTCYGSPAMLTATGATGNYAWYDSAAGGNLLSSAEVYVTPALTANATYYVETTANGCISPRTAVTVTVNPIPQAPTVSGTTVCPGSAATLTANTGGGTAQWYNSATGGTLLATGNTFTTPALTTAATYYVQTENGGCVSTRTSVNVGVTPAPASPQFLYSSGTFCSIGNNPSPTINNPAGGTFSASPAGLKFISTATGQVDIAGSAPGVYVVTFVGNDPCATVTQAPLVLSVSPIATFNYAGPYCQGDANPFPTFATFASPGKFSAAPAGLVFVNLISGEIDLAKSKPGTYTITNTIASTGGCPGATASFSVTINEQPIINAGPDQSLPTGSPVQLAATTSANTTSVTWSGGTGSFSNASSPNAIYTPGPGETSATLTLTSDTPPGPCGPAISKVNITFTTQGPTPAAPTATGTTICPGSNASLSATAPGGTYQWFDAATGGNLLSTGPVFTTPVLTATTTYYVQTTINGVASSRTAVTVTISSYLTPPVVAGAQICAGNITTLTATGSAGTYKWFDAPVGGNLLSTDTTFTTPVLSADTSYYVQASNGGCISGRTRVIVKVSPVPHINSAATANYCSGNPSSYTITADQPGTTFLWSRAQVAGISNTAVSNQNTSTINETLINTTQNTATVTYVITPMDGTCPGPSFNYVVAVYPTPVVTSPQTDTICDINTLNYTINFNLPNTAFTWSRAAVAGISNLAVSGQTAGTIKEVLFNTTNTPVSVTYTINYGTSTCAGTPFNVNIIVNPLASITSPIETVECSGTAQNYVITSNIPSATFNWSRVAVPGISNPAVSNQTSNTITETLINTTDRSITLNYQITPIAYGCNGVTYPYAVVVKPVTPKPVAHVNSPLCIGGIIHLRADTVKYATYQWTGPNGFTSTLQNPDIPNATLASAGSYSVIALVDGCNSQADSVTVIVDEPPVANAGTNQTVCITTASIPLLGSISSNDTGIWTTAGTGTFSPAATNLATNYLPSDADRAAGFVKLTLTSTNTDGCTIATSNITITFGPLPAANAGPDQEVCSQDNMVKLNGKILIGNIGNWISSGTGTFSPASDQTAVSYLPSQEDIRNGSVTLTLSATGISSGPCYIQTDDLTVKFIPPANVDAGGTQYLLKGKTLTLNPTVSENDVHYLWAPNIDISNDTLKNPVISANADQVYTLTVTDSRGCVSESKTSIIVEPGITVVNTFTPNGDGINDYWDIPGLEAYTQTTVDIFNRYGQKVFHSLGYGKPWDGRYNGEILPVGVYYYIINLKELNKTLSGSITIIR